MPLATFVFCAVGTALRRDMEINSNPAGGFSLHFQRNQKPPIMGARGVQFHTSVYSRRYVTGTKLCNGLAVTFGSRA
ncbi:hypothetical protein F4809DRAFT_639136 [Biscogniauxia mediterranea]|nr:hypothetical protein F4809DRAFT_639136 [Biscogniauxia mediterranea]